MEGANLSHSNLYKAQMKNCNLIGVKLGVYFENMGHDDNVSFVSFSKDNRFIISRGDDSRVKIWDFETGDLIKSFKDSFRNYNNMRLTTDDRYLVSGNRYGEINIFDLEKGTVKNSIEGHSEYSFIAVSHNSRFIASGSLDQSIKIWDLESGDLKYTIQDNQKPIISMAITRDDRLILSGHTDGDINI